MEPERAAQFEAEQYLMYLDGLVRPDAPGFDLANRVRQQPAKPTWARSWEEYWQRAAPVLEEVWGSGTD